MAGIPYRIVAILILVWLPLMFELLLVMQLFRAKTVKLYLSIQGTRKKNPFTTMAITLHLVEANLDIV